MVILTVIMMLSMCRCDEIVDIFVGSGPIALIFFAGNTIMHNLVRIGYDSTRWMMTMTPLLIISCDYEHFSHGL